MPKTWKDALRAYRYPVTRPFSDSSTFAEWQHEPADQLQSGNRKETIAFENYFRAAGKSAIGPWAEVVFWKLASQGGRADIITRKVLEGWKSPRPAALWDALTTYIEQPTERKFDAFRKLFGFSTKAVAIVATFPAFYAPDRFAMVDTRVAKWVRNNFMQQNAADLDGPQLVARSRKFAKHEPGLLMGDFRFMLRWTDWCLHTVRKLTTLTREKWRARDVEMAVFEAQGDRLSLNALPQM